MRGDPARTATCALDVEVRWGDGELLASDHLREVSQYQLQSYALSPAQSGFVVQRDWLDAEQLTLADVQGDQVVVRFVGGAQQTLRVAQSTVVPVGPLLFRVHVVQPQARPLGASLLQMLSPRLHAWTFASMAVHALALCCMALLPPKASSLSLDLMSDDMRTIRYLAAPIERLEDDLPWTPDQPDENAPGPDGAAHAGDEGQAGKPDVARSDRKLAVQGRDNQRVLPSRTSASEVRTAGILGVLAASQDYLGPSSPFGPDAAAGYDAKSAMGALFGNEVGDNFGFNGLGMRNTGSGGGGDAKGTIGVGKLGTGDGARGTPGGLGWSGPRREARVPVLRSEAAEVRGSLSKETIRRTIQRHLNEVRFCYENGLSKDPQLAGRLAIQFLISPSGVVQHASVHDSTLPSKGVADCVRQAMRRVSFPAPDGGGYVQVTYPFSFAVPD